MRMLLSWLAHFCPRAQPFPQVRGRELGRRALAGDPELKLLGQRHQPSPATHATWTVWKAVPPDVAGFCGFSFCFSSARIFRSSLFGPVVSAFVEDWTTLRLKAGETAYLMYRVYKTLVDKIWGVQYISDTIQGV